VTDEAAIQIDTYLDWLLRSGDRAPSAIEELPEVEADLDGAANALKRALVRFHPSFGFEERLAARLRADAASTGHGRQRAGRLIDFPGTDAEPLAGIAAARRTRGLLVGGAIASGVIASGVSLAGAALVAWRRSRVERPWEPLG
jgi:hypothetical protein